MLSLCAYVCMCACARACVCVLTCLQHHGKESDEEVALPPQTEVSLLTEISKPTETPQEVSHYTATCHMTCTTCDVTWQINCGHNIIHYSASQLYAQYSSQQVNCMHSKVVGRSTVCTVHSAGQLYAQYGTQQVNCMHSTVLSRSTVHTVQYSAGQLYAQYSTQQVNCMHSNVLSRSTVCTVQYSAGQLYAQYSSQQVNSTYSTVLSRSTVCTVHSSGQHTVQYPLYASSTHNTSNIEAHAHFL